MEGQRDAGVQGCGGVGVIVSFTPSPIHPFTPSFLFTPSHSFTPSSLFRVLQGVEESFSTGQKQWTVVSGQWSVKRLILAVHCPLFTVH